MGFRVWQCPVSVCVWCLPVGVVPVVESPGSCRDGAGSILAACTAPPLKRRTRRSSCCERLTEPVAEHIAAGGGGAVFALAKYLDRVRTACALRAHCVCTAWALRAHCVRTACILRTQIPGYSPKNTCHLTGCTAKQQSPHENDETAFNLVLHCPYEQTTQPCKVRLLRVFECPWLRSWQGMRCPLTRSAGNALSVVSWVMGTANRVKGEGGGDSERGRDTLVDGERDQ